MSTDADRPYQLATFHGGLRLEPNKALSTARPLAAAPIPPRLIHPLSQHAGSPSEPIVAVGDSVRRMQPLSRPSSFISAPVHAGSSGVVVAIEDRPVAHPSGLSARCVVVDTDGEDRPWTEIEPLPGYVGLGPPALRARIRDAGIVGLGGAVFPTAVKLNVSLSLIHI